MTKTDYKIPSFGIGDDIKHYDDGKDGHPEKMVNGIVTGVSECGISVKWEDLEWETEYDYSEIEIEGNQIYEVKRTFEKVALNIPECAGCGRHINCCVCP